MQLLQTFLVSTSFALAACALLPTACHAAQGTPALQAEKSTPLPPKNASRPELEQFLIAKEQLSWDLAIKRDEPAYRALHAPNFFTVSDHGVTGRAPSEASAMDSNVRFDSCDLAGFTVHFIATDVALITYHVKATGSDHGQAFLLDSYASSLWTVHGGTWLNDFYQSTPSPAK
jgi:hypothetical protein